MEEKKETLLERINDFIFAVKLEIEYHINYFKEIIYEDDREYIEEDSEFYFRASDLELC